MSLSDLFGGGNLTYFEFVDNDLPPDRCAIEETGK